MENVDLHKAHIIKIGEPRPLADTAVDLIVSNHVLKHVANAQELANELYRVLAGWLLMRA